MKTFTVLVRSCQRCGADHSIEFKPLTNAADQFQHWGMCPVKQEPVSLATARVGRGVGNTNAAKLTIETIQAIRSLSAARFTALSIAKVFGVCGRTIRDVLKGRRWQHLSVEWVALPRLSVDDAARLRLLAGAGLSDDQRERVERYANTICKRDDDGHQEALANYLLNEWLPTRPNQRRTNGRNRTEPTAQAVTAGPEAGRDSTSATAELARG